MNEMNMISFYIILLSIAAVWGQQNERSTSDILNSIPTEFQSKVDSKQIENFRNKSSALFKEKCENNGGPDAYSNAESAFNEFKQCIEGLVNVSKLQSEIEEAKPVGKVDEVFKTYCARTPDFKYCFTNLTESAKPCFTETEQKNLRILHNITEELAKFICHKEGDRIALFIAEGGPECFQMKQEALQECVNQTLGSDLQQHIGGISDNFTLDNLPIINFDKEKCANIVDMQHCVVGVLENCTQPTTGNIVDSMFKYLYKLTPCKKFNLEAKKEKNLASGFAVSTLTISAVIIYSLCHLI